MISLWCLIWWPFERRTPACRAICAWQRGVQVRTSIIKSLLPAVLVSVMIVIFRWDRASHAWRMWTILPAICGSDGGTQVRQIEVIKAE